MKNMKIKTIVSAVTIALLSTGCASIVEAEKNIKQTNKDVEIEYNKSIKAPTFNEAKNENFNKVNKNWVDPTPLDKTNVMYQKEKLPAFFQDKVSLTLPGKVSLIEIASELQRSNNIKFSISQDVYNVSGVNGKIIKSDTTATATVSPTVNKNDPNASDIGTNGAVPVFINDFVIRNATLENTLNLIASKGNIAWKWNGKAIELYRYETKTYNIASLAGKTSTTSSVTIQSDGGGAGGAASGSGITRSSEITSWDDIKAYLLSMLSPNGTIAVLESSGLITVKDTPAIQAQIGKAVKDLNSVMSQQIYMDVNVYSVSVSDEDNYGVNWDLLYNKATSGILEIKNTIPTVASATLFNIKVVNPTSRYDGTSAVFQALSTIGKTSVVNQFSISTLNGQTTPIGNNRKISYIQSISSTPSTTSGVAPTVSITPASVYQGIGMSITPRLQKDTDKMLLEYSLSLNDVEKIEPFTTGSDDSAQTIQLPTTTIKNILQRARLKSGQTLILSGFKQKNSGLTYSGVGSASNQALGGNRNGKNSSQYLVITVTPYIAQDNN